METAYMLKESTVEAVARAASQAVDTPLCVADAGLNVRLLLNDDGAYFYICGDAKRMAKDVETALLDIFKTHGGLDDAGATPRASVSGAISPPFQ